ncbi:MAG: DUF6600 domain-containing protein [Bryobacteraceae bacterium]
MKPTLLKLVAVAVGLAGVGWAQEDDNPGRGVARVSVINGDVSVRRGDTGDWVAAAINAPLVVEDRLTTGEGSRAEVQFDWANMIRLAPMREIRFSELEYHRYQVQVARGLVTFRVLRDVDAQVEISTPSVSVRPAKKGIYRIEVSDDGTTAVTVRKGEAEIFTPRGSETLGSGHTMLARGSASDPEFQMVRARDTDDWDRWNAQRDNDLERSRSYQYVDNDIYGAEDLDSYGRWVNADSYGWVWTPRVAVGWAPYHYGRWMWIDWYGWSWVSYDPWGWAPYHYGRWFNSPMYGWCWWPGGRGPSYHHYWSPGLVAFFGWGGHGGGVGIGFGNVGWVPLAPHEPYHRWYGNDLYHGYRGGYIDNSTHIVNNINIVNNYRNARVTNGMTGIDADGFVRGRRDGMRSVGENDVRSASLARGVMPVTPNRESLRMSDREVRGGSIARSNSNERFFSSRQPARVDRVSFDDQRRSLERVATRTTGGGDAGVAGGRVDRNASGTIRNDNADRGGWRRADTVDRNAGARSVDSTSGRGNAVDRNSGTASDMVERGSDTNRVNRQSGDNSGWRRFGQPSRTVEPGGTTRVERSTGRDSGSVDRGTTRGVDRSNERGSGSIDRGTTRGNSDSNGRRSEGGAGNSNVERVPRSTGRENFQPESSSGARSWGSPRSGRSSEGQVRISPPIVRERSSSGPSYSGGSGRAMSAPSYSGGGGGRGMSAPSGGGGVSRGGGNSGGGNSGGGGGGGGRGGRGR